VVETGRVVLLEGGVHRNKGDELMLLAARARAHELFPEMCVGRPVLGSTSSDRVRLQAVLWPRDLRTLAGSLGEAVIGRYAAALELRRDTEVGVVLDVSGWTYGDRWGPAAIERAATRAERRRRHGCRTVLLPQSLGTFESDASRAALKRLVEAATLVCARDRWSHEQVTSVVGDRENVLVAPDYSIDVPPAPTAPRPLGPYLCIVPNHRVVRELPESRATYVPLLAAVARHGEARGLEVVQVLHTHRQDDEVADDVDRALGHRLLRVQSEDSTVLKGMIGGARAVVGSRYHALVSALTQAVPVVGIGWAPKYEALFDEYRCSEALVESGVAHPAVIDLLDGMLDGPVRSALIEGLEERAAAHREAVDHLWRRVGRVVAQ
jgi:colanic acid/amylovoran biosynthesis protein